MTAPVPRSTHCCQGLDCGDTGSHRWCPGLASRLARCIVCGTPAYLPSFLGASFTVAAENRPQRAPVAPSTLELSLTEAYWMELLYGLRTQVQREVSRQNGLCIPRPTHDLHPSSAR